MKYKYRQRNCDWCCKEWEDCETKPGFVQYLGSGPWEICGACKGTALVDDRCYCYAQSGDECFCDYTGWEE